MIFYIIFISYLFASPKPNHPSSRHYAGDVVYNINGFMEKNKDTLFQDFKRLLYSSNDPVIKGMWPEGAQHITMVRALSMGKSLHSEE